MVGGGLQSAPVGVGFRVFVSAVSSEFGEARSLVGSDLRARGIEVKVQEDFRQEGGSDTTLALLHDYIAGCDAVVAVVGRRSGSVPPAAAVARFGVLLPRGLGAASYTQWEVLFARHHHKRLSLFHADDAYNPDQPATDGDDAGLQTGFVSWLFDTSGLNRRNFDTPDRLRVEVLREDWPLLRGDKPVALPYPSLGGLFTGREAMFGRLHASLAGSAEATAIAGQVLHGLGGVGKTRLAVEYAWRHVDDYSAVLFVAADTPSRLAENLAALCGPDVLDLAEWSAAEQAVRVAAVLGWLADHPGWLIIFDNLDSPEAAAAVEALLPRLRGGNVLITSRLADWGAGIETLELDVLDTADAATFLLDRTERRRRRSERDDVDADVLAGELGGLALALEQAGAYIVHRRCSLGDYLAEWRSRLPTVLAWHDQRLMRYPTSVAVTWQTTIDQLDPGDVALLLLLAWFAPEPIPLFVFDGERADTIWRSVTGLIAAGVESDGGVLDAAAGLAGYSMVRWDTNTDSISVHRVVQQILRDNLDNEASDWIVLSLRLLDAAYPGDPGDVRTWDRWDLLRPHVTTAVTRADEANITTPTSVMMSNLAQLLVKKVLYHEAEPLMRRALSIDETIYGPDHPQVATDLSNLASLLLATNRLDEAEPLMRRALSIDEAAYGPDDPQVAIMPEQPRPTAPGHQPARPGRTVDAPRPDHRRSRPRTRPPRRRHRPEQPRFAAPGHQPARRGRAVDAPRPEHRRNRPRTRPPPRCNRAEQPRFAARGHQPARRCRTVDAPRPEHRRSRLRTRPPQVAIRLNNLAQLLQATNRFDQAEPLMRRALSIDETAYGPDHPQRRHHAEQPRPTAQGHQPARRSRTVDATRPEHRRNCLRTRPPPRRHRARTTSPGCSTTPTDSTKPNH